MAEEAAEICEASIYFDLRKVHDHFDRSLLEDEDICIKDYLEAYTELFKFFQLMGSVFSFVSTDLKQKIEILQKLIDSDPENYVSIKKMVDYEKQSNLFHHNKYGNGSRTLLRLHRGLDFISEFLGQLNELSDTDNTSGVCQEAYNKTLAKHHAWLIRKAACVAMYTMPTREVLLKKVCGDNVSRNIDILPKMLDITSAVIARTDTIYQMHSLHMLP
ncbi:ceramide-1-phosphate transfer protein [Trichogramma pretiosum]|uniref:ceramide-1-phosphate transfer protein n=1 Tax=Trichogramma pretiosum TaxID=7493 RepID=UPI0006C95ED3|nr:ceramide-1-phosphate transfer protein [Trichogramma pretiosum]